MKKSTFIALLLLLVTSGTATAKTVVATENAASPSTADTTQKLRERIEKIVDEKRGQVEGTITDLSERKRGFIGEVQRVTQETITLKNHKGTQIIAMNHDITITKAGKSVNLDTIAVGDWVIVIGTIEDDAFTPKRIIVSSETLRPKDHVVALGSITERTTKTLTVLTRTGETTTFQVNAKTIRFQDSNGDKATAEAFVKDMQVLVVGYETADGKFATTIRTIVPLKLLEENE